MTAWHGHYCLHLDERGRPCNMPTMRLGMCSKHRESKPQKRNAEVQRKAQARFRAKRAKRQSTAGLAPAFEGA
jgi:hypothetical protein